MQPENPLPTALPNECSSQQVHVTEGNCYHDSPSSRKTLETQGPQHLSLLHLYETLCDIYETCDTSSPDGPQNLWKFLLITVRLDLFSEALKASIDLLYTSPPVNPGISSTPCASSHSHTAQTYSCPNGSPFQEQPIIEVKQLGPTQSWKHLEEAMPTTQAEYLRYLFLVSRPFRVFLAIIQWCEWKNRTVDGKDDVLRSHPTDNYNTPLYPYGDTQCASHLRYTNTTSRITKERSAHDPPLVYHLDLPFTLPLVGANATITPARTLPYPSPKTLVETVSPVDTECASQFYKTIWTYLTKGEIGELTNFTSNAGEPWINSLLAGQLPLQNSNSLLSILYDAALNSLPELILHILQYPSQDQCLGISSWIHGVILERSSEIIRTTKIKAEEFDVGNPLRDLLVTVAQRTDHSNLRLILVSAFYGYLCGSIDAMLPATHTWSEALWAHCIALQERLISTLPNTQDFDMLHTCSTNSSIYSMDLANEMDFIFNAIHCYRKGAPEEIQWNTLLENLIKFSLNPSVINNLIPYAEKLASNGRIKLQFWIPFVSIYKPFILHELDDPLQIQHCSQHIDSLLCHFVMTQQISLTSPLKDIHYLKAVSKPKRITTCASFFSFILRTALESPSCNTLQHTLPYHDLAPTLLNCVTSISDIFSVFNLFSTNLFQDMSQNEMDISSLKQNACKFHHMCICFLITCCDQLVDPKYAYHQLLDPPVPDIIYQLCSRIDMLKLIVPLLLLHYYQQNLSYLNSTEIQKEDALPCSPLSLPPDNTTSHPYISTPLDVNTLLNYRGPNTKTTSRLSEAVADQTITQSIELIDIHLVRPTLTLLTMTLKTFPSQTTTNGVLQNPSTLSEDLVLSKCLYARTPQACEPLYVQRAQPCWDVVKLQMERYDISLTPLIHFLSVRHLIELFLTLKDTRLLLMDSVLRITYDQPFERNELLSLLNRLSQSLDKQHFVESPYHQLENTPERELTDSPKVITFLTDFLSYTTLKRLDQQLNDLITRCLLGFFVDFTSILSELPQTLTSHTTLKYIKEAVSTTLLHVISAIQCGRLYSDHHETLLKAYSEIQNQLNE